MSKTSPSATSVESDVDRTSVNVHMNKDLIKQFDKILSVSCQRTKDKKCKGRSVAVGLCPAGRVQRKSRKTKPVMKKGFVLRPSKLKVPNHDPQKGPSNHFSFANCSKELESIIAPSESVSFQALRPRSASLPGDAQKKAAKAVTTKLEEDKKPNHKSQEHRVVKKRKHNLGSDEEEGRSKGGKGKPQRKNSATCAQQARQNTELSQDIDRLADYLEESILLPKKMSYMAEMMYT